jgi:predicted small metal-binding protein
MKTLTCSQMGGPCDAPISGSSKDELMVNGMKHLEDVHPEMAEGVKKADPNSPMMIAWNEKFNKDFEEAPEA